MTSTARFTPAEHVVLRMVQQDIPDSLTPFSTVAQAAGMDEEALLAFLRGLKDDGTIRRFGASIKHQKAGYAHNVMAAWAVDDADPEHMHAAGRIAAANNAVSHCYHRPTPDQAQWPYTLFTMIHGRTEDECRNVLAELDSTLPHKGYAVLPSLRELKKISMTYFTEPL